MLRRIFAGGENFFDWSLPLYTASGIQVRIHLTYLVWMIASLLMSLPKDAIGWQYMGLAQGSLLGLVLLHEYGHCIACRAVGGTADRIVLWPLGGLAFCAPPHHWRADLATTLGGPLVNAGLLPVFGGALLFLGQSRDTVVFNPFHPVAGMVALDWHGTQPFWLVAIWWLYYTNLVLLAFNMLVPMFPLDAGRVLHAALWRRMGHRQGLEITVKVGLIVAIVLLIFGALFEKGGAMLMLVAGFGLFTCLQERQRLRMIEAAPAPGGYDFSAGYTSLPPENEPLEDERAVRARERQRKQEQDDQAELDRILAKIASAGMGSLSRAEKRWLERATERRRRG